MLNRNQIIEILKKYRLDINHYVVISGAAMVLLGIKDTTGDIDIAVTEEYYNYLLTNYDCTFHKRNPYNHEVYYIDEVINFGTDYYPKDYLKIEEISVQKPADIKKLKQFLNREKDKKDIELINQQRNE